MPASPPKVKTMDFVDTYNAKLVAPSLTRTSVTRESGCTGTYSLRSLPNHDRYLGTPVEPMHVIKNIGERIVKLLSGASDTVKLRKAEQHFNRFPSAWVKTVIRNEKETLYVPSAPFALKKEEAILANARAMCITAPSGMACHLFGKGVGNLNSNQWKHVLSSGILKYCIRGLLGPEQRDTLVELCDVMQVLCAETVNVQNLDSLEYRVHRVLSLLERDFPVSLHVISLHLLHHLPTYLRRFGSMYGFWMYPMERFNSWISCRILNRRFPESNVMETYRIFEFAFFLQKSAQLPNGCTIDIKSKSEFEDENETSEESQTITFDYAPREYGTSDILDSRTMTDLTSAYCRLYPDYAQLLSKYKKEQSKAKRRGRVENYPSLSEWSCEGGHSLTQSVLNMSEELSCSI